MRPRCTSIRKAICWKVKKLIARGDGGIRHARLAAESGVHRVGQEVEIFELAEDQDIQRDAEDEQRPAVADALDRGRQREIRGEGEREDEDVEIARDRIEGRRRRR